MSTPEMNDHDLLITIHEQVKQLKLDIQGLNDNTSTRVLDHENRIRRLEIWGFTAIGVLLALQFYFNYLK